MGASVAKPNKVGKDDANTAAGRDGPNGVSSSGGDVGCKESKSSSEGLSKNAHKKLLRRQRWEEKRKAQRAERKHLRAQKTIEKRKEREEHLKSLTPTQRDELLRSRSEKLRVFRAEERRRKEGFREALLTETRYNVCIDLGWNQDMHEKEIKSLCRQLMYSYNAIRRCFMDGLRPLSLTICGIDDNIRPTLSTVANGWESWPIKISDEALTCVHDAKKIVYLTHDAEDVLESLNEDDVYVIGGIVDRNRLKGATKTKADKAGVRAARLNLDSYVSMEHGTRVLTVNHCVDILIYVANGTSWGEAYKKVLPDRKGLSFTPTSTADSSQSGLPRAQENDRSSVSDLSGDSKEPTTGS